MLPEEEEPDFKAVVRAFVEATTGPAKDRTEETLVRSESGTEVDDKQPQQFGKINESDPTPVDRFSNEDIAAPHRSQRMKFLDSVLEPRELLQPLDDERSECCEEAMVSIWYFVSTVMEVKVRLLTHNKV
ncbi:hypothetical protein E6O75_ATG10337 [Venturia nashicola]|uniref:Uncharacterized protein n=1 Tax=Venturia nashicola TaxID=86259 RepID=A0A4Z1NWC8_9PEZI|nr:hypothetical protein E6O75_ATG10337 [Venturia nashicola]